MKRVLQIVGPINGGGVSGVVYNYLSHMDMSDLYMDILAFRIDEVKEQMYDIPLRNLGCTIHYFEHRNKGYISHFKKYKKLLRQNHYDVVHCHFGLWSAPYLMMARRSGVSTRIAHAHGSASEYGLVKSFFVGAMRPVLCSSSTHKLACGAKAGRYLWGEESFTIINNAVDLNRFKFDKKKRDEYRKSLNLTGMIVGFVGRLCTEKNLDFIVEIAKELKLRGADFKLLVVGDGGKTEDLKLQIESNELHTYVIMLGIRTDIPELMQAMDCMILPSLHEGFPVVAVEAQASGLPVFLSDTISDEVKILATTIFLPINEGASKWANEITEISKYSRVESVNQMQKAGYDISTEAQKLRNIIFEK